MRVFTHASDFERWSFSHEDEHERGEKIAEENVQERKRQREKDIRALLRGVARDDRRPRPHLNPKFDAATIAPVIKESAANVDW